MNIDQFKTVCVVGFSRSGVALLRQLRAFGKNVLVSEARQAKRFSPLLLDEIGRAGIPCEFGGNSARFIKKADLIVVSPGVDLKRTSFIESARKDSIPLVGELEFASWLSPATIVAITGTNGKSTTTFLTYLALKSSGANVYVGGNIGIPFSLFAHKTKKDDIVVLEVSSFQLETIREFKPHVACILNLEPDHLDRYGSFFEYIDAKANIFKNQTKQNWAVLNKNLVHRERLEQRVRAQLEYFSQDAANENIAAACKIGSLFGIDRARCLGAIENFRGLPHRMQQVRTVRGVIFVNDSKATNPASTVWALKNTQASTILIAGGKDKGLDYSTVLPYLTHVKKVNLIGEAAPKIKKALSEHVLAEVYPTLDEVVRASFDEADVHDTVLFSPMCASFDMFRNYIERGLKFIETVKKIDGKTK